VEISWRDFEKVDLRVGTIVEAKDFPAARKPAYQLLVDFGDTIGLRKASAQITALYKQEDLIGRQVIAVINFPKKQIGKFMSECLVTGVADEDGNIVLATVERKVPNGTKLI